MSNKIMCDSCHNEITRKLQINVRPFRLNGTSFLIAVYGSTDTDYGPDLCLCCLSKSVDAEIKRRKL